MKESVLDVVLWLVIRNVISWLVMFLFDSFFFVWGLILLSMVDRRFFLLLGFDLCVVIILLVIDFISVMLV